MHFLNLVPVQGLLTSVFWFMISLLQYAEFQFYCLVFYLVIPQLSGYHIRVQKGPGLHLGGNTSRHTLSEGAKTG